MAMALPPAKLWITQFPANDVKLIKTVYLDLKNAFSDTYPKYVNAC